MVGVASADGISASCICPAGELGSLEAILKLFDEGNCRFALPRCRILLALKSVKTHSLLGLALLCAVTALAQRDFSNVEIKAIPVAKHIYMLEGAGGNIGACTGEDGNLIVDD